MIFNVDYAGWDPHLLSEFVFENHICIMTNALQVCLCAKARCTLILNAIKYFCFAFMVLKNEASCIFKKHISLSTE